ncbi:MAG: hypothetical protein QM736_05185 [Vicinamibacterales bacterium]
MFEESALEPATSDTAATLADDTRPAVVRDLDDVVNDVVRLGAYHRLPSADGLHMAIALSHRLQLAIAGLQENGFTREQIVQRLEQARAVHAESPFIRRLQDWPRGYPGDFETIEYLMQQQNRATPGRLWYWLEQYALGSALAQQHRNKADLQARTILETVFAPTADGSEPRVLILAAGSSPDVRQAQPILAGQRFHAVLLDQDADALAFSRHHLLQLADRLTFVKRHVVRGLQEVRPLGPFHLVLAGGLFDYLPARVATMVLKYAREHLLAAGGRFVFTNIADSNLYRPWMEHMADWLLIHRTEADVRALATGAGFDAQQMTIERERTGLTYIVDCRRDGVRGDVDSRD